MIPNGGKNHHFPIFNLFFLSILEDETSLLVFSGISDRSATRVCPFCLPNFQFADPFAQQPTAEGLLGPEQRSRQEPQVLPRESFPLTLVATGLPPPGPFPPTSFDMTV